MFVSWIMVMFASCFMVKADGWSWLSRPRNQPGTRPSSLGRLEVSHALRIGRCECGGALGLRRVDPDGVDFLLGLLGDVADQLHLALPAAREQRTGFAEVETGDVGLLVIGFCRNAQQFG